MLLQHIVPGCPVLTWLLVILCNFSLLGSWPLGQLLKLTQKKSESHWSLHCTSSSCDNSRYLSWTINVVVLDIHSCSTNLIPVTSLVPNLRHFLPLSSPNRGLAFSTLAVLYMIIAVMTQRSFLCLDNSLVKYMQ